MLDFILGFILGNNTNKNNNTIPKDYNIDIPKEEKIIVPKVIKYAFIPEIFNFSTTIEDSYNDYEKTNLVCIYKNNKIYYYLEVEVPVNQNKWGEEDLLEYI